LPRARVASSPPQVLAVQLQQVKGEPGWRRRCSNTASRRSAKAIVVFIFVTPARSAAW
jgi:hypothetical protein